MIAPDSNTAKSPLSRSTIVGMRPFGLIFRYQGSFCSLLVERDRAHLVGQLELLERDGGLPAVRRRGGVELDHAWLRNQRPCMIPFRGAESLRPSLRALHCTMRDDGAHSNPHRAPHRSARAANDRRRHLRARRGHLRRRRRARGREARPQGRAGRRRAVARRPGLGSIIGTIIGLYSHGPKPYQLTHGIADDLLADLDARKARCSRSQLPTVSSSTTRCVSRAGWRGGRGRRRFRRCSAPCSRTSRSTNRRVQYLDFATRFGAVRVRANGYVDSSGDATITYGAGLEVREPEAPVYGSLNFLIEDYDPDAVSDLDIEDVRARLEGARRRVRARSPRRLADPVSRASTSCSRTSTT